MDLVIIDHLPVNALNGVGLHSLLAAFARICLKYNGFAHHPKEYLPGRKLVSDRIIERYNLVREKLRLIFGQIFQSDGAGGAICIDLWTEKYKKKTYLGVVVHYVDENFRMNIRVIGTRALEDGVSHTGEYIHSVLKVILDDFNINIDSERITYVTDRGSNLIKALQKYKRHSDGAHFLHNTLEKVLSEGRPQKVVAICGKIVTYFKQSGKNRLLSTSLKSNVETGWNSTLTMLDSIKVNWESLNTELRKAYKLHLLDDLECSEIVDLTNFLEKFLHATKKFEERKDPSLHWICIMYKIIMSALTPNAEDSEVISAAKTNGITFFTETLIESEMVSLEHKIALFLHPTFKSLKKMTPKEKLDIMDAVRLSYFLKAIKIDIYSCIFVVLQVKRRLTPLAIAIARERAVELNRNDPISTESAPSTNTKEKTFNLFQLYDDELEIQPDHTCSGGSDLINLPESEAAEKLIHQELQEYGKLDAKGVLDDEILNWWRDHSKELPLLSHLSRSIFSIPAGSASVESNFSVAGLFLTVKRSKLGPERLDHLLVCHSNADINN